jgi:hypothetical protein
VSGLRAGAALVVLALGATPAAAGSISINMTATAELRESTLAVSLKIDNSGDEAASSVRPVLRLGDQETRGTLRGTLRPGEAFEESLTVAAPGLGPGRWPYRVAVDYTDANQYPFQALHVAVAQTQDAAPAKVVVRDMSIPGFADTATTSVHVKNLSSLPREATVTLFAPEGLEVPEPVRQVRLDAWGEGTAEIRLVNRSALPGSRYPVFAAAEYEEDGVHQTTTSHAVAEIRPPRPLLARGLLWAVGALVVVWIALLVWRSRRRRAA